jgi:glycosyltransferase involved in cell wall biosynthesis
MPAGALAMRVLYPVISGSGVEVYTARLIAGLAPLGWNGQWLPFSPRWEYFPWGLKSAWKRAASSLEDCSLVHVNADYGCYFSLPGKPLVATLHHSSIDSFYLSSLSLPVRWHHRLVLKPSVERTLRQAEVLVAVSRHTRATFCEVFQADLAIEVIPNGIDTTRFRPIPTEREPELSRVEVDPPSEEKCPSLQTSREVDRAMPAENTNTKGTDDLGHGRSIVPHSDHQPIVLFFSGNASRRKGADLFVPVMNQLGRDFELRVTGGLRRDTASFVDAPNIRYLGRLSEEELIRQINEADIAFQPSRREGFGLSILEAMACGKPIVSSNASAIPEVVVHEKGGYLCEAGSVSQLVEAIRRLAGSPSLRSQMGQFNRQVVQEKFTLDRMARAYCKLYRSLTP